MGSWERERRYQEREEEEQRLLRRGPSPGKRSLTHRFAWTDADGGAPDGIAPDPGVRSKVEAATGGDLSTARVHVGPESQSEAAALRAKAFTVGRDIHFAAGQYQPGTAAGAELLAHELVHTLQQGAGGEPTAQRKASDVSQEGDAAEREADRIAHAAISGTSVRVAPVERAAPIARTPETMSGNPAERTDPTTGAPTTTHRSVGVSDAANAPAAPGAAGTETRATNVKPKATQAAPLHFAGSVCPLESAIFEEDTSGTVPAPPGFTSVAGFNGTVAAPIVQQEADPGIYINGAPAVDDIQQGGIGDCYFLALTQSIVARDPGKIPSIMAADGRGGATVTLWRARPRTPTIWERIFGGGAPYDWIQVAVSVSDQLAVTIANNRVLGAQVRCAPAPKSQDYWATVNPPNLEVHRKDTFELGRWAPLLEKAYARFAQTHDNYGGAREGAKTRPSGYDAINGGWSHRAMCIFYGPEADDPNNAVQYQNTNWAPGSNVVTSNAAVMEQLVLLQGRGSEAAAGDTNAPIVQATSSVDPLITRLTAAIVAAQIDPDYVNVDASRQALVGVVATSIPLYTSAPADPAPPAPQPKANARAAIGTACVNAVRPGVDESAGEQQILNDYFRAWGATIQFAQGDATVPAPSAAGMRSMSNNMRIFTHPQTEIHLDGHASAEGTDESNMTLAQQRVDNVETAIMAGGAIAPHTVTKTAHGEEGATRDASWRKVAFDFIPRGHRTNSLLDARRSRPIRDMADLMVDLRNIGTDNSPGQRNIYGDHVYSVVAVSIVTSTGATVALNTVPAAQRAALYPLVDPNLSTVTLRNPHRGNEPDRLDNRTPQRAGDGAPSGPNSDGLFTVSLYDFFLHYTSVQSGVMPRT